MSVDPEQFTPPEVEEPRDFYLEVFGRPFTAEEIDHHIFVDPNKIQEVLAAINNFEGASVVNEVPMQHTTMYIVKTPYDDPPFIFVEVRTGF